MIKLVRPVGGMIVDVDDLRRSSSLLQGLTKLPVELLEALPLVPDGENDGDLGNQRPVGRRGLGVCWVRHHLLSVLVPIFRGAPPATAPQAPNRYL